MIDRRGFFVRLRSKCRYIAYLCGPRKTTAATLFVLRGRFSKTWLTLKCLHIKFNRSNTVCNMGIDNVAPGFRVAHLLLRRQQCLTFSWFATWPLFSGEGKLAKDRKIPCATTAVYHRPSSHANSSSYCIVWSRVAPPKVGQPSARIKPVHRYTDNENFVRDDWDDEVKTPSHGSPAGLRNAGSHTRATIIGLAQNRDNQWMHFDD